MARVFIILLLSTINCIKAIADDIVVAKDGTGDYVTVQEAINAVKDTNPDLTTILIKKGVYEEKVYIPLSKNNINIVGEDRDSTIITYADHAKINNMGTFKTYTLFIGGSHIKLQNLTVRNNAPMVAQAVALHIEGSEILVIDCNLLGNQDTLYTGNNEGQEYFENCYIEGTTDFIFGPATVWFEKCTLHSKKDSYITASSTPAERNYGYIFNKCMITAEKNITKVYLGRPWRDYAAVLFMHCTMGKHILPEGWHNWNKPEREKTSRYCEYANKGKGSKTNKRVNWSKQLNKKEAEKYTLKNVFPEWQPK